MTPEQEAAFHKFSSDLWDELELGYTFSAPAAQDIGKYVNELFKRWYAQPTVASWEYQILVRKEGAIYSEPLLDVFKRFAVDGWRLCAVYGQTYYFIREIV